jgi:hypothetical protein
MRLIERLIMYESAIRFLPVTPASSHLPVKYLALLLFTLGMRFNYPKTPSDTVLFRPGSVCGEAHP